MCSSDLEPSNGTIYPKHRHDLLETAVVTRAMLDGRIESTSYLRNPLDVLAQQIVAHVAMSGDLPVEKLALMIRRTAAFAELGDDMLHNVLDLLSGRYPSEEFSELRPRIVWDRIAGTIRARDGAQRLAQALVAHLYAESIEGHFQAMQRYVEPELLGDEWTESD